MWRLKLARNVRPFSPLAEPLGKLDVRYADVDHRRRNRRVAKKTLDHLHGNASACQIRSRRIAQAMQGERPREVELGEQLAKPLARDLRVDSTRRAVRAGVGAWMRRDSIWSAHGMRSPRRGRAATAALSGARKLSVPSGPNRCGISRSKIESIIPNGRTASPPPLRSNLTSCRPRRSTCSVRRDAISARRRPQKKPRPRRTRASSAESRATRRPPKGHRGLREAHASVVVVRRAASSDCGQRDREQRGTRRAPAACSPLGATCQAQHAGRGSLSAVCAGMPQDRCRRTVRSGSLPERCKKRIEGRRVVVDRCGSVASYVAQPRDVLADELFVVP